MIGFFFYIYIFFLYKPVYSLARPSSTRKGEFPHHVSIYRDYRNYRSVKGGKYLCGGSLLNSKTVITTGVCAAKSKRMEVIAGLNSVSSEDRLITKKGVISKVEKIIMHEGFKSHGFKNKQGKIFGMAYDLALLILEEEILEDEEKYIRYVDIDDELEIVPNTYGFLPGFGRTEKKSGQEVPQTYLNKISIPVVDHKWCNCSGLWSDNDFDFYGENIHFCAGNDFHEGCKGDFGGAFVRLKDGKQSKRWTLFGLFSFEGFRFPLDVYQHQGDVLVCGRGYSGMTRMSYFKDWVWYEVEKPPPPSNNMSPLFPLVDLMGLENTCFGIDKTEIEDVCSGNGKCVFLDTCECSKGWGGNDCSKSVNGDEVIRKEEVVDSTFLESNDEDDNSDLKKNNESFVIVVFLILLFCLIVVMFVFKFLCEIL